MKLKFAIASAIGLMITMNVASAQQISPAPATGTTTAAPMAELMSSLPTSSVTVTQWYKQNIYDKANVKLGDVSDVLVSPTDGKITTIVLGVGGFLGIDQKNVGVPFSSVTRTMKDGKPYLTINTTKDALNAARGLKYESSTSMWIMANAGSSNAPYRDIIWRKPAGAGTLPVARRIRLHRHEFGQAFHVLNNSAGDARAREQRNHLE